jgi:hypothetical protein
MQHFLGRIQDFSLLKVKVFTLAVTLGPLFLLGSNLIKILF